MWSLAYWRTLGERAFAVFAAVLATRLGGGDMLGVDVLQVDWATCMSFAAGAALMMVLLSVGASAMPAGGRGVPMLATPPSPRPRNRKRSLPESVPPRLRP